MNAVDTVVDLVYLAVAAALAAIIHTHTITTIGWVVLLVGSAGGAATGLRLARQVEMTAVPQVVSVFNAVGGGAAALIAITEFLRVLDTTGHGPAERVVIAALIDVVIGSITLFGSLVAAGKLQGWIDERAVVSRGTRLVTVTAAVVGLGAATYLLAAGNSIPILLLVTVAALVLGITTVLPIGGADMPVVVALLNSCTGLAVAVAGFVIGNAALIVGGAIVGASGAILTLLMARAMNRSILNIVIGGFGATTALAPAASSDIAIRRVDAEDAAMQMVYADKVAIVPGYGLAAAQAQHEVGELAKLLQDRGVHVFYAIHPVAGANDVTNPAARHPGNSISGMPILDVDQAKNIIVVKRSTGPGYAGIPNELYTDPKTGMYLSDAKAALTEIIAAIKTLVAG